MTKRYMAWADDLRQKGRWSAARSSPAGGVRHIKVKDGKPVASDGPYAEAKDVIGGYFVIEAKDAGRGRGDRPGLPASRALAAPTGSRSGRSTPCRRRPAAAAG